MQLVCLSLCLSKYGTFFFMSHGTTLPINEMNGVNESKLGDTVTPLKWAAVLTVLNAVLDPLFIFPRVTLSLPWKHGLLADSGLALSLPGLGMGCAGAAAGTAVAQYVALAGILLEL